MVPLIKAAVNIVLTDTCSQINSAYRQQHGAGNYDTTSYPSPALVMHALFHTVLISYSTDFIQY